MSVEKENTQFAHQSHADFNRRFEPTSPASDVVNGPWLSNEAVMRLPNLKRDFDRSRDPSIAAQLDDLNKSETQRREEQSDAGAKRKDRPKPELKPPQYAPPSLGASLPDQRQAEDMWLTAERDFVMNNRPKSLSRNEPRPVRARDNGEPDLSP